MRRMLALLALAVTVLGLTAASPASAAPVPAVARVNLICSVPGGTTGAGLCGSKHQPFYSVLFTLTPINTTVVTVWDPPVVQGLRIDGVSGCNPGGHQCLVSVTPISLDQGELTITVHYYSDSIVLHQARATAYLGGTCPVAC